MVNKEKLAKLTSDQKDAIILRLLNPEGDALRDAIIGYKKQVIEMGKIMQKESFTTQTKLKDKDDKTMDRAKWIMGDMPKYLKDLAEMEENILPKLPKDAFKKEAREGSITKFIDDITY